MVQHNITERPDSMTRLLERYTEGAEEYQIISIAAKVNTSSKRIRELKEEAAVEAMNASQCATWLAESYMETGDTTSCAAWNTLALSWIRRAHKTCAA